MNSADLLYTLLWQLPSTGLAMATWAVAAWLGLHRRLLPAAMLTASGALLCVIVAWRVIVSITAQAVIDWAQIQSVPVEAVFLAQSVISNMLQAGAWFALFAGALAGRSPAHDDDQWDRAG